jgi:hypothetical protein
MKAIYTIDNWEGASARVTGHLLSSITIWPLHRTLTFSFHRLLRENIRSRPVFCNRSQESIDVRHFWALEIKDWMLTPL